MGAQQRLVIVEGLVGIDHQVKIIPRGCPHRRQPRPVIGQKRLADFDLGPGKPLLFDRQRILDQCGGFDMQPATFGGIQRDRGFCPARQPPQWQSRPFAAQIPQGGVNRGQSE